MEDENYNSNSTTGGSLIGLIIIVAICWWGYNHFIKKDYSKPWWEGTAAQEVCSTGDSQTCYRLSVYSDGEGIDTIYFPDGGYLSGDSECFEAASIYNYDHFCRFYDQEGRLWDVIPL